MKPKKVPARGFQGVNLSLPSEIMLILLAPGGLALVQLYTEEEQGKGRITPAGTLHVESFSLGSVWNLPQIL